MAVPEDYGPVHFAGKKVLHSKSHSCTWASSRVWKREYYKENPNEIIGKTITVQYFEESQNQNGEFSLRFPVVKCIYENGRDV